MSEVPRDDSPEAKRRKVRRGTQSCWECKRRKVRCIFPSSTSATCNNCQRRGTACISQELPSGPIAYTGGSQVEARLDRLEKLIAFAVNSDGVPNFYHQPDEGASESHLSSIRQGNTEEIMPTATPAPRNTACSESLSHPSIQTRNFKPKSHRGPCPLLPSPRTPPSRPQSKHEALTRKLLAAWPSQDDFAHICTLPSGPTMSLNCGMFTSCARFPDDNLQCPQELLKPPPIGSHPILIASKLLLLGTFLHEVPLSTIRELGNRGTLYIEIMHRVVDTATRLVTTNEDLICSVEAIECIMIEAIYQNHAGNLHRSWMALHRAISAAQIMAIHRGLDSPSLKFLEPANRATFDPDRMCFRLVQMDRYLSIMLGLPPSSLKIQFATSKALEGCSPLERMERVHCVVADDILRRSDSDLNDLTKLHEDDKLLQKIASDMPSQWWLPDFATSDSDGNNQFSDTVRIINQFAHYHILIRLHLPYVLRSSTDHRYDHSKITAFNASREILSRYQACRASRSSAHFYCRGDEFIAFISIIVMCIAHMNSGKEVNESTGTPNHGTVLNFLAHSRPSDRGMMERTLEIFESRARNTSDKVTSKLSRIIHNLLTIEAQAASGTIYSTSSSAGNNWELEFNGKLADGGKALNIYIPYLGSIDFKSGSMKQSDDVSSAQPEIGDKVDRSENMPLPDQPFHPSRPQAGVKVQTSKPSDVLPGAPAWDDNNVQSHQMSISETGADWDLQGIDTALFDSLFRGADIPCLETEEFWTQWAT